MKGLDLYEPASEKLKFNKAELQKEIIKFFQNNRYSLMEAGDFCEKVYDQYRKLHQQKEKS